MVIIGRSPTGVAAAVEELRGIAVSAASSAAAGAGVQSPHRRRRAVVPAGVYGVAGDVTQPASMAAAAAAVCRDMGGVDVWINAVVRTDRRAGGGGGSSNGGTPPPSYAVAADVLADALATPLVGTANAARTAMRIMLQQPLGGHIFNLDPAPRTAAARLPLAATHTAAVAVPVLSRALGRELRGTAVGVHRITTGPLAASDASGLATVARWAVPALRGVAVAGMEVAVSTTRFLDAGVAGGAAAAVVPPPADVPVAATEAVGGGTDGGLDEAGGNYPTPPGTLAVLARRHPPLLGDTGLPALLLATTALTLRDTHLVYPPASPSLVASAWAAVAAWFASLVDSLAPGAGALNLAVVRL